MATAIERLRSAVTRQGNRKTEHIGAPALTWRAAMRRRVVVLAIVLGLWATGIQARLVYLQVIDRADLVDRAARQQLDTKKLPAKRGDIVDRHGRILATSVDADTVIAVPSAIDDERGTVTKLCAVFKNCTAKERQDLVDRLKRQRHFAYIRRQVTQEEARQIRALNLDGIGWLKESRRYYPKTELAAHLLGFVGLDGKGLGGLEAAYDSQIRGKDGQAIVHADARRHVYDRSEKAPTMGATIELTVDEYLQHIAEKELHAGVLENKAAGGSVVMMNPHTGEILAMANEPTFNPNLYREASEVERRNRAVQDLYVKPLIYKALT